MITPASSYKKDRQFFIRQMYLDNGFFNTSQSQKGLFQSNLAARTCTDKK
jgi:hypothetical protein